MSSFQTLLTGGGLAALGVVVSGLLTNWLGARRDKRRYDHEHAMAAEAHRHEQAMAADARLQESDMARETHRHSQAIAAEARRQERLEQAYIELLGYLSRQLAWAKSVRPFWGQPPTPDPLPREEHWRIEALVTAYGSPQVRELLRQWGECAAKIEDADATIRMVEGSRNPNSQLDQEAQDEHLAISSYKAAMFKADEALRERVRQELAGEV
jgi:hypothetical protein